MRRAAGGLALTLTVSVGCIGEVDSGEPDEVASEANFGTKNASGFADTFFAANDKSTTGPFFQSMGSNGRTCVSCHVQGEGWSITPAGVKARFDATQGMDPIFRLNDGAVSPNAVVGSLADRQKAYKLLLSRGLVRVGIGIPAGAEFSLQAVDDPYGYASAAELSMFRRPLPTANLAFLATVMWDGRETHASGDVTEILKQQARDATTGHAQAGSTDQPKLDAAVVFEKQLFTAQTQDSEAGPLTSNGALGGPDNLANQQFFIGINDVLSPGFNPNAFTLFNAWQPPANPKNQKDWQQRYSIFRGQQIFNTKQFQITGVAGLNDDLGVASLTGTCTSCHDTPNVGNHSVPLPINIGIGSEARRTSDLPLYTLRNNTTGATIKTTDPGRALITGKWKDIGKFKGPILRGLQARPPFFHDGSAATLQDVINFYNTRFSIGLTAAEQADLLAFLQAL